MSKRKMPIVSKRSLTMTAPKQKIQQFKLGKKLETRKSKGIRG